MKNSLHLSKVTIKNFRCFSDVSVEFDKTTIFIGENNSGKTSFLDALKIVLSRVVTRKGGGIDDYDHRLSSDKAKFEDSKPLSIVLDFVVDPEVPDEIVQSIGELMVFDKSENRHIILRLASSFDKSLKEYLSDWDFLDDSENPLGNKTKQNKYLYDFLKLKPLYYLSALRDIEKEFSNRSSTWASFLKNPDISDDLREKLQNELNSLNAEILNSHTSLLSIKKYLTKVQDVISGGESGKVDIEALPGRITELLSRTQVNITSNTGAKLPLNRHGSGTQSLAVIFLFEAFLSTMLEEQFSEFSYPILTLEEPEAHLHPCAIRSLWNVIEGIPGQKIIATHSGDLLSRVPLSSIRRFCRLNGEAHITYLKKTTLDSTEEQKIKFHILSSRGELLFARCWLLCEGESEFWAYNGMANLLDYDLDRLGIRIVNTSHSALEPLLKVANDFKIEWLFTGDGDDHGAKDERTCKKYLLGRDESKHIHILSKPDIEELLCANGFGSIFEESIVPQKRDIITAEVNTPEYWHQVVKAQRKRQKPKRIKKVIESMYSQGKDTVPDEFKVILESTIKLAESQI